MRNRARVLAGLFLAVVLFGGAGCTRQSRTTRHLALGEKYFSAEEYDRAEMEYLQVLQATPLHPVAVRQLGTIYQEQGRWPDAYSVLKKALELDPQNIQTHLQLGLTYLALQDRGMAAKEANWVLDNQPGQELALSLLADCCASAEEVQQIQTRLQRLVPQDSDRAAYHVALSALSLKQQDLTNAEAEVHLALKLDPNSAAAQMALGNLYWVRNDFVNADKALEAAAELSSLRSPRRLAYAEFKLRLGSVDAAKDLLREITRKAPDYLPALNLQAEIALAQKNFVECNSFLQRVLARNSSNFNGLLTQGNLALAQGDFARAVANFEHLAALYDRSPVAQFQLARAYVVNGDTIKAISKLNRAIAADPNYAEAILLLATIDLRRGRALEAITTLKELLKQQPQMAQG